MPTYPAGVSEIEPVPSDAPTEVPESLFAAMLADPVHAPERLALEAVRLCGPETARWAARTRQENPYVTTAELAMRTRERFTRLSQASGAASGVLGLPGSVADLALSAWSQARLILALAALHGLDPTDDERAAEILYFTGAHKAIGAAERALAVVSRRAPDGGPGSSAAARARAAVALTVSLGRMLGRRTVKRLATRAIPLGSVPIGAWSNGRVMRELADRVVLEYARRLGVAVPPS